MITKQVIFATCAAMALSAASASAGPCNTGGKDAGSAHMPAAGQTITTGSNTKEHGPTETIHRVTGDTATSSQDAQRHEQGQPTTAQQAEGAEPSAKMTGQNQPTAAQPAEGAEPSAKMADEGC